mgnify:FL=1
MITFIAGLLIGAIIGVGIMCLLQVAKDEDNAKSDIKVIKWISYDDAQELISMDILKDNNIGGLGGWFKEGDRWLDYKNVFKEFAHPYQEALREAIIDRNLKYCGNDHQELDDGVPVFSDFTVATYSYRAWGDLMAAIWSTAENKDYSYIDFYMSL